MIIGILVVEYIFQRGMLNDKHAFIVVPETEYYIIKPSEILDSHKHRLYMHENKYFAFTLFNIINSIVIYSYI